MTIFYFVQGAYIAILLMIIHYIQLRITSKKLKRDSEFWNYEIDLRNRFAQNDVTLRVTHLKVSVEIILSSY